jgi:hypothetical protein
MFTCESVVDVKPREDDAHRFPSSVDFYEAQIVIHVRPSHY